MITLFTKISNTPQSVLYVVDLNTSVLREKQEKIMEKLEHKFHATFRHSYSTTSVHEKASIISFGEEKT